MERADRENRGPDHHQTDRLDKTDWTGRIGIESSPTNTKARQGKARQAAGWVGLGPDGGNPNVRLNAHESKTSTTTSLGRRGAVTTRMRMADGASSSMARVVWSGRAGREDGE